MALGMFDLETNIILNCDDNYLFGNIGIKSDKMGRLEQVEIKVKLK